MVFSQTHAMSDPTFSESEIPTIWTISKIKWIGSEPPLKSLQKRGTKRYTKGTKFYEKVRNLTYILTFPQVDLLEYASRV